MKRTLLLISVILGAAIFFLNRSAMEKGWYTAIPWFDVPMHFFGGMFVLFALAGFFFPRMAPIGMPLGGWLAALSLVLAVGLLWEAFEYYVVFQYLGGSKPGTGVDFYMDLALDVLGAATALLGISFMKIKYNRISHGR